MVDPYREDEYLALERRDESQKEKSEEDKPPPFKPVSIMKTNIIDAVQIHKWVPASDKNDKTVAEIMKEKREAAKNEDFKKPWKPNNPLKKGIKKVIQRYQTLILILKEGEEEEMIFLVGNRRAQKVLDQQEP